MNDEDKAAIAKAAEALSTLLETALAKINSDVDNEEEKDTPDQDTLDELEADQTKIENAIEVCADLQNL